MSKTKRLLSAALALCMTALLCVPALALSVSVSKQAVTVDGKAVSVQPYNINGYNFFKLRDIAALVNGTGASFEVGFSSEAKKMYVVTGKDYTSVGGELSVGQDQSATCVKSAWTLAVNGKAVSCEVYNIGGNNYFKLRDLGGAVGFSVDYDSKTETMLITTGSAGAGYAPDMTFSTTDQNGKSWDQSCFADNKLTMINRWAYWCGPCVNELPDLQKLSDNYKSKGLLVLGCMDGSAEDLAVLTDKGLTYPNLYYVNGMADYLDITSWPTTIFVDSAGKVVGTYVGSRSYRDWSSIIDGLLK